MPQATVWIVHVAATWYMVGLIWMVQIVHYNLFDRVGLDQFAAYEADHNRLITPIVAIPMLIELLTAAYFILRPPIGVSTSWMVAGLGMVIAVWLVTATLSVPYHGRLMNGFDANAYRGLVLTNWLRTGLWSARGLLVGWITIGMLSAATKPA